MTLRVGEAAARLPDGAWMVGGSWGAYEQWEMSSTGREGDAEDEDATPDPSTRFDPDRSLIDPVSPGNPAILWNWDRSLHLANGAALEAAGAECDWQGVECEDGEMTGRVNRAAANRIRAAIPPKTDEQRLAEARTAPRARSAPTRSTTPSRPARRRRRDGSLPGSTRIWSWWTAVPSRCRPPRSRTSGWS